MAYDEMDRRDYENTVDGLKAMYEEKIANLEEQIEENKIKMRECADELANEVEHATMWWDTCVDREVLESCIEKLRRGTK